MPELAAPTGARYLPPSRSIWCLSGALVQRARLTNLSSLRDKHPSEIAENRENRSQRVMGHLSDIIARRRISAIL